MINPRTEDPLNFWELNIETGIFLEFPDEDSCDFQKASYTIEVLQLNDRETLIKERQNAVRDRYRDLSLVARINEAQDFNSLNQIINESEPFINLDHNQALDELKRILVDNYRASIRSRPHPTVWEEIKRQEQNFPNFQNLFDRLPEARNW